MASAWILLAVTAAMLAFSGVVSFGSSDFFTKHIPTRIVESADADMDGKASVHETLHLLTLLFYKTNADELSVLDTDADGFLSAEELKIEIDNTEWLRDYVKLGRSENLTAYDVLRFLTARGVDVAKEYLDNDEFQGLIENKVGEAIHFLLFEALASQFLDRSMVRAQLRFANVLRVLMTSNSDIEGTLKSNGSMKNGSCSTEWFVELMTKYAVVLDPADFGERTSPAEIRQLNVTRMTLSWPVPDASGKFSVGQIVEFGRVYRLGYGKHVMIPAAGEFPVEVADVNGDSYLSEAELHVWLKESAGALLDKDFRYVMRAGVKHFLGRVANVMDGFSGKKLRKRRKRKRLGVHLWAASTQGQPHVVET